MIQPIKAPKSNWFLYWVHLEEPVPSGDDWFLPTLVIVCDRAGTPLAPPEMLEELDQTRIENFLYKLFDRLGQPDRLTITASDEWDPEAWKAFSADCKIDLRFQEIDARSPDEIRALTKTIVMRVGGQPQGPRATRELAAGLARTALRMRSPSKKSALLKLALDRDPDCAPARVELADLEFQNGNWKACLAAYEEVVKRESTRWTGHHAWWTDRATRPFLRAIYGKAMTLWHLARYPIAARTLEELLALNPKDNQGARFLIPMLHLLAEAPERAAAAFQRYAENYPKDYAEPSFLFGWGLCYSLEGREQEARAKYIEGSLRNIYLAPMLLEQDEPPKNLWFPNDRAEPGYAAEFIESYAVLWDREPGALRLLREIHEELQPRIAELVAHRSQMADFQDQRYDPDYKQAWQDLVAADEKLMLP
ncbi:MAG: tetratricopeptide repeat protein [Terrimicrobiaceae bacterium]|nr:tetratricopeptide repeat protein [Terrimicrobiaceae bacterium]